MIFSVHFWSYPDDVTQRQSVQQLLEEKTILTDLLLPLLMLFTAVEGENHKLVKTTK